MASKPSRFRSDEGSILPLIIGACALALALILGVSTATSLYVERKRLLSIADGAALVAAQSFDHTLPLLTSPSGSTPQLSRTSVIAGASSYFTSLSSASLHEARLVSATTADARTAFITVQAQWQPPVISYFFPNGFPLEATSSARSIFTG